MSEYLWPVVPICDAQKLDVRWEDLVENGVYRICDTYRGGGGYDQYPQVLRKRKNILVSGRQFVVQLQGCPLDCPYCYVTKSGVFGEPTFKTTTEIIDAYKESGCDVFHLMGGAPALHLPHWKDISCEVDNFHSDFLLIESEYRADWLSKLPGVHAVSLKERCLYSPVHLRLLWYNLAILIDSGVSFYVTFTGNPDLKEEVSHRFGHAILRDSFEIEVVEYNATNVEI